MGWASGSSLMRECILAVKRNAAVEARVNIYHGMITAFRDHDCDTLRECLGADPAFDEAYMVAYPSEAGYRAAMAGKPLSGNPHSARSNRGREWADGWREGMVSR